MAFKACDDFVRAYWVCRSEAGLAVVFKCRSQFNEMNMCLKDFNSNTDAYEQYKAYRLPQLKAQFRSGKPNPEYYDKDGNYIPRKR